MMNGQKSVFRYDTAGRWFKGNCHIHSRMSDGAKTFTELADMYCRAGYHFLYRADHWLGSRAEEDKESYPLLWMDGAEIDGQASNGAWYHVLLLGRVDGLKREMGLDGAIDAARKQNALVILAHPFWTGNTIEDALAIRFDGVEIYNHVSRWLNGKSDSMLHWTSMLEKNPAALALASDDAHISAEHPVWNGGWIVVNAPECSRGAIADAILRGNYFSSCGPDFVKIEFDGAVVNVETSPVRYFRLTGPAWRGERLGSPTGPLLTRFSMKMPQDYAYAYIEIEDEHGSRARTNALFVPQDAG